jgi:hypothetical protein
MATLVASLHKRKPVVLLTTQMLGGRDVDTSAPLTIV